MWRCSVAVRSKFHDCPYDVILSFLNVFSSSLPWRDLYHLFCHISDRAYSFREQTLLHVFFFSSSSCTTMSVYAVLCSPVRSFIRRFVRSSSSFISTAGGFQIFRYVCAVFLLCSFLFALFCAVKDMIFLFSKLKPSHLLLLLLLNACVFITIVPYFLGFELPFGRKNRALCYYYYYHFFSSSLLLLLFGRRWIVVVNNLLDKYVVYFDKKKTREKETRRHFSSMYFKHETIFGIFFDLFYILYSNVLA